MGYVQVIQRNKILSIMIAVAVVTAIVLCIALPLTLLSNDSPVSKTTGTPPIVTTKDDSPITPSKDSPITSTEGFDERTEDQPIECPGKTKEECEKWECLWQESAPESTSPESTSPESTSPESASPNCTMNAASPNYLISEVKKDKSNRRGFSLKLKKRTKSVANYSKEDENEIEETVTFDVTSISENTVRIRFIFPGTPDITVPLPHQLQAAGKSFNNLNYTVSVPNEIGQNFSFQVVRNEGNTVLFDSRIGNLILSKTFNQISGKLPTDNVYGIGENIHSEGAGESRFKHDFSNRKWPLFSRDEPPRKLPKVADNLYGVHPYYTCLEKSGKSHGVLFHNSNPMEFLFSPSSALTFRSVGGYVDMYFILGHNPEDVVVHYSKLVGFPMVPPIWALGFQLSRYGYNSLETMRETIKKHRDNNLPLDVVHADIDHMHKRRDFTFDPESFAGFDTFVIEEQEKGLHIITILDPAIEATEENEYDTYKRGFENDVYIKWDENVPEADQSNPKDVNTTKRHMYGRVWPQGPAVFPDFMKKQTQDWWKEEIRIYNETVAFDGIWIDMNEPANFGTNEDQPWICNEETDGKCVSLKCPSTKEALPFLPSGIGNGLEEKTLCLQAVQGEYDNLTFLDVHSLYGLWQSKATYDAVAEVKGTPYPLVISRSTYPSSGRYAGHWLGDNESKWQHMRDSIVGMLEFSLFNIPYIGADVCGFFEDAEPQMCARWMQLGAFYPFYRNHNGKDQKEQDPVTLLKPNSKYYKWAEEALKTRYSLIPYLHTLHFLANEVGGTVVRPVFHEFPLDKKTYSIDRQFMWGPALLISPVLDEDSKDLELYLPKEDWYNFYTKEKVTGEGKHITVKNVDSEDNKTPLHVRAGYVIPLAEEGAMNTKNLLTGQFHLHIFPNEAQTGQGIWYHSDTLHKNERDSISYHKITTTFYKNEIKVDCGTVPSQSKHPKLTRIWVYNTVMPTTINFKFLHMDKITNDTITPREEKKGFSFQLPPQLQSSEGFCLPLPDAADRYYWFTW